MAANPVVVPYFDLSLQHASGRLLRAMRRPGDGVRHLELIDRLRGARPDAAAGSSPSSGEEGTPAADLPGRVPPDDAAERTRLLQEIQEEMTAQQNARQVGRVLGG